MAGGLLNLVAGGNQTVLIFGNPQKTYWTSTFKCITNFGLQNFRIDYTGLRQLGLSTSSTFLFKVKRYADLLMDNILCINIPDIYSPVYTIPDGYQNQVPYEFQWIKNLGAMMIQTVRFTIGGNLIQEITNHKNLSFTSFRDSIYDILIYNLDVAECIWYILYHFIQNKNLSQKNTSELLEKTYTFLKYYNNNYRPIYHLESIMFYFITKVHNYES
jgi:hypothetical protein